MVVNNLVPSLVLPRLVGNGGAWTESHGWLFMMTNNSLLNSPGLAAIAAATALLATPVLAQDVPVASDPAPIVADTPLPAEPVAAPTEAASDPLAPAAATTPTPRTTRTTRPTRATATAARAAPAPARAAATAAPATPAAPAELSPAAAEAAPPAVDPLMVAPLPEPAVAAPAAAGNDGLSGNDLLPVAGAAGLAVLGLAGAALAMRRRRRDDDEVMVEDRYHEPVMSRAAEPAAAAAAPAAAAPVFSAPLAKPAFNWGNAPRHQAEPINRIEAAKRGPTPDNPSLSLKKRLQRAAFFDQRERQAAAGEAVPVSPMAGLPDALVADQPAPDKRPTRAVRAFEPA